MFEASASVTQFALQHNEFASERATAELSQRCGKPDEGDSVKAGEETP